jgi:arsenite-transporting ATPase
VSEALPESVSRLLDEVAEAGRGMIMVMGKGGVGKTTIAAAVAVDLASRGLPVHLSTTDPAAHVTETLGGEVEGLTVTRIDPRVETERYIRHVMQVKGKDLDDAGRDLLAEDLRSPCTEEVAVFHAFSRIVNEARRGVVVLDTAPTGHTIRLLETIERTRGWVQALLSIFLKYREVVRLDEIAADLVEVSRSLGRFGDLLKDPVRTEFVVVSRAAAVVREETDRLLRALGRAGVSVSTVVVNGLTGGTCRRCARRMIVEKDEIAWLRRGLRGGRLCPAIVTTPAVLPPPCGADQLARWARQWTVVQ